MKEIYLDNAATTKVDKEAAELMLEVMLSNYANPSSLHDKGLEAEMCLLKAKEQTAKALGCEKDNIFFTSGGTEANNLSIFGGIKANSRNGNTIVVNATEHSSVIEPMKILENEGYNVKYISPLSSGEPNIEALIDAVDNDTVMLSCMMVNSETGAVSDIEKIASLAKKKNPKLLIHCDAVQGFGKLPFKTSKLNVDFLSVSGHKIHAPKGIGAVYIKNPIRVTPICFGGGQQKGIRPGTEPLPNIAAFGLMAEKLSKKTSVNLKKVNSLRDKFIEYCNNIDGVCINSDIKGTPYICNLSVLGYRSEIMLHFLSNRRIFVSSGSACSKGKKSHVLKAMMLDDKRIDSALRLSFCHETQPEEIDEFFAALREGMSQIARS